MVWLSVAQCRGSSARLKDLQINVIAMHSGYWNTTGRKWWSLIRKRLFYSVGGWLGNTDVLSRKHIQWKAFCWLFEVDQFITILYGIYTFMLLGAWYYLHLALLFLAVQGRGLQPILGIQPSNWEPLI